MATDDEDDEQLRENAVGWYRQNLALIEQRDLVWEENRRLRREIRRAIKLAWAQARGNANDMPSRQVVDEIVAAARGLAVPLAPAEAASGGAT